MSTMPKTMTINKHSLCTTAVCCRTFYLECVLLGWRCSPENPIPAFGSGSIHPQPLTFTRNRRQSSDSKRQQRGRYSLERYSLGTVAGLRLEVNTTFNVRVGSHGTEREQGAIASSSWSQTERDPSKERDPAAKATAGQERRAAASVATW